jgi:hypothetical protein
LRLTNMVRWSRDGFVNISKCSNFTLLNGDEGKSIS